MEEPNSLIAIMEEKQTGTGGQNSLYVSFFPLCTYCDIPGFGVDPGSFQYKKLMTFHSKTERKNI